MNESWQQFFTKFMTRNISGNRAYPPITFWDLLRQDLFRLENILIDNQHANWQLFKITAANHVWLVSVCSKIPAWSKFFFPLGLRRLFVFSCGFGAITGYRGNHCWKPWRGGISGFWLFQFRNGRPAV